MDCYNSFSNIYTDLFYNGFFGGFWGVERDIRRILGTNFLQIGFSFRICGSCKIAVADICVLNNDCILFEKAILTEEK